MPSLTNIVAALAGAASVASAVTPLSSVRIKESTIQIQPARVIVEFKSSDAARTFSPKRDLHAELFEQLDRRGIEWETNSRFDSELFHGASLTLSKAEDVDALNAMDIIESVRPIRSYEAPRTFNPKVITGPEDKNIPQGQPDATHVMTGVAKLHARGIKGKGVRIGIVDSGVDYKHPSLGGGFGKGFLVSGGYDFVGDDYTGQNTPVPDADPLDQCGGHGTHVAGIIAMQANNPYGVVGAAPEAELHSYRVFGCSGSVDDEIIIKALLRAYDDACDVITLSLGGPDGWVNGASSVVASRIAKQGRVVTIAAGNEGAEGAWYTSSPGNGLDVISVGSVDNTEVFYNTLTVSGVEHEPIAYSVDSSGEGGFAPVGIEGEWPLYALSTDPTIKDDACNPLAATTPDLSGFITLIRRGTCNFSQKLANAAEKGAKAVIFLNNGGVTGGLSFNGTIPAVIVDTEEGNWLLQQVVANAPIKVSFPKEGGVVTLPSATGGLSSEFSTYGPTNDGYFKPALSAPGGQIMATWPTTMGSWIVISGTSMATPHVAGISALLLQANNKSKAVIQGMRTLLQTTSTVVAADKADGVPANTLAQAGAGLVNVYNALTYKTKLSVGHLQLNDTASWKADHSFTIKNTGKKAVKYKVSHVPAATARTIDPLSGLPVQSPLELTDEFATAKLSAQSVTVQPGKTATIKVKFTAPAGVDAKTYPVVSGHIQVEGAGEILKVSYIGTAGRLRDLTALDGSDVFFGTRTPVILNAAGEDQQPNTSYTLADGDAPSILFRLAFGTPRLVVDLVSKDLHTKVTIAPPTSRTKALPDQSKFDNIPTLGRLGENFYLPRTSRDPENGYELVTLPPAFGNGTAIPPGEYRILLRAQHVGTDRNLEASYDVYMSNSFSVVVKPQQA